MADDQHRAVIIGNHFLQQVERFQIQVVGRLVQHQQVGFARKFAREQQARTLPARQRAHLRLGKAWIEQKVLEIAMDMLAHAPHIDPVAPLGQHFADRLVALHQAALLVDEDHVQRLGLAHRPAVGLQFAGQQFQQRRLARAIAPDNADPVAALHAQRQIVDDDPFTSSVRVERSRDTVALPLLDFARSERRPGETLGRMFDLDDALGLAVVARHRDLGHALRPVHSRARLAHFPQLGQPPLVALAPRGDAPLQPVRLDLQLGVQLLRRPRLFGIDRLHPLFETAKADLVAAHLPPVQPQRLARQPRQEGAVMADDDEAAIIAR